ncbi:hypothetical protein RQP46_000314 [Phenoliferia psychrophenolica]
MFSDRTTALRAAYQSSSASSDDQDEDVKFDYTSVAPSSPRPASPSESFTYVPGPSSSLGSGSTSPWSSTQGSPEMSKSTLVSPTLTHRHLPEGASYYSVHAPAGFVPSAPTSPVIPLVSLATRLANASSVAASAPGSSSSAAPPAVPRSSSLADLQARAQRISGAVAAPVPTPVVAKPPFLEIESDRAGWYQSSEAARAQEVARLEERLKSQTAKLNELNLKQQEMDKLRDNNDALLKTIANLRKERKEVEARAIAAGKEATESSTRLAQEKRSKQDVEFRLKEVVAEIVGLEDAKESADKARTSAIEQARDCEKLNSVLRSELHHLKSDRDRLSTQLPQLEERLRTSDASLDKIKAELDERTRELATKTTVVADAENQAAILRAQLGQKSTSEQRLTDECKALREAKNALDAQLEENKKECETLSEQVVKLRSELESQSQLTTGHEGDLKRKIEILEQEVAALHLVKSNLSASEGRVRSLSDQLAEAESKLAESQNRLSAAESSSKAVGEHLSLENSSLKFDIGKLRLSAETDQLHIQKLQAEKSEMSELIRDLLDELQDREAAKAGGSAHGQNTAGASSRSLISFEDENNGSSTPTARSFQTKTVTFSESEATGRHTLLDIAIPSGSLSSPDANRRSPTPNSPKTPSKIFKEDDTNSHSSPAAVPPSPSPSPSPKPATLPTDASESPSFVPAPFEGPRSPGSSSGSGSSYHSNDSDEHLKISEAGVEIGVVGGEDDRGAAKSDGSGSSDEAKTGSRGSFVGSIFFGPVPRFNGHDKKSAIENADVNGAPAVPAELPVDAPQPSSSEPSIDMIKVSPSDGSKPEGSSSSSVTSHSAIEALLKIAETMTQSFSEGGDDSEEEEL